MYERTYETGFELGYITGYVQALFDESLLTNHPWYLFDEDDEVD